MNKVSWPNFTSKSVTSLEGIRPFRPPETCSAPTTFRRRRRHVADQVYVTSTSIPYLTLKFNEIEDCHQQDESDKNTAYYNTSSYASDDTEIINTNCKRRYAAFRTISLTGSLESQEITLFLGTFSESYYYDYVNSDDDFDSFDSESDSDFVHVNHQQNDSGVDMGNYHLLDAQTNNTNNQIYGLTRFVATAGKHMKRLRRNWSMNKNDITKSLSRITKNKSETNPTPTPPPPLATVTQTKLLKPSRPPPPIPQQPPKIIEEPQVQEVVKLNTFGRKKNWLKFRRAFSMTEPSSLNTNRSTFYLTDEIDVDALPVESVDRPSRRSQSVVVRPQNPPPPVPIKIESVEQKVRSTSWYTECGVFKANQQRKSHTCWYAEVGLYQEAGSKARNEQKCCNSSDYSECSVTNENWCYYNKHFDDNEKQLIWKDEPLYQFYDAAVIECDETSSDNDYESFEEITQQQIKSIDEDASPVRSRLSKYGRTLWCEIPEVIQSNILDTLTTTQKKLQEAKFEIVTSEASYLNSLKVLEEHFIKNLQVFLNFDDRKILFGNIKPVRECSEHLLSDLESCWDSSILLKKICCVINHHCAANFSVYIRYCVNQIQLDATLKRCRGDLLNNQQVVGQSPVSISKNKNKFSECLKKLEASPTCQSLSLYSFLMLPMQRITRLPLLIDAVLSKLTPSDEEYEECEKCFRAINEVVMRCNEGAREAERLAEVQRIAKQLEYGPNKSPIIFAALQPNTQNTNNNNFIVKRWLVRSGDLIHLTAKGAKVNDDNIPLTKLTFGKRFTKLAISLFLFEDMLIVARKKGDGKYLVQHHCPRPFVEVTTSTPDSDLPISPANISNNLLLFVTLLENQDGRTIELMLSCSTESDRQRWLEALRPTTVNDDPGETIYESWDCPQVKAVHFYQADQPDELALTTGDVVNVEKKMTDGWYYGTRLRDGVSGWFPGNHTLEIVNPHVRARNLRQRYRLLAITDTYLNKNK